MSGKPAKHTGTPGKLPLPKIFVGDVEEVHTNKDRTVKQWMQSEESVE